MDVRAVLVAVAHATDHAGVVIDGEGDVWLTGTLERGGGTLLSDYLPKIEGLEGNRTVLGGRLPAGAVAVEAVTDGGDRVACEVGDGAWVVVIDQPATGAVAPVVRRDYAGAPVAPPLPGDWSRVPVTDSDERCPACEALAWDVVTPSDCSRGGLGGGLPAQVIVCRVCGHEEMMGSVMRFSCGEDEDPAVVQARIRDSQETQKLSHQMLLGAVTFPIYAAERLPGRLGGSSSSAEQVSSVTVSHGERGRTHTPSLRVTTTLDDRWQPDDDTLARAALAQWLFDGLYDWTGGSDAAFVLKLRADERARKLAASRAAASVREIVVDDVPHRFTCVRAPSSWAAVARSDSLIITVTATGTEPEAIRLRAVPDPITTLI
ncbi:MAG: hypothetical protein ACTHQQ_15985 [Solirubrobacteraceae bacterium]